jgi:hypothetical protein
MMTGAPHASEAQLAASAAGDQLEVAVEVTAAPEDGLFVANVLERSEQDTYRRSSRTLRVRWGQIRATNPGFDNHRNRKPV